MKKNILITGATDGIGLATVKLLAKRNCHLLIHGRNIEKLNQVEKTLKESNPEILISSYQADLSSIRQTSEMADRIATNHQHIDVLINNAGVYSVKNKATDEGLDGRFAVNVISPYILARKLINKMNSKGRVINLSSAAQAPFDVDDMRRVSALDDGAVYAKSKLALAVWTRQLAHQYGKQGPVFVAINPASMLASKMVKQAYGIRGNDLNIGAKILEKSALDESFSDASGKYFDNDVGCFASLHPFAESDLIGGKLTEVLDLIIAPYI